MAGVLSVLGDWADKVPGIFNSSLKYLYKQKYIEDSIIIALDPHKEAVQAQVLDNTYIRLLLRVANFTPFPLTVENVTLELSWDNLSKKIHLNNFEQIAKCRETTLLLRESLSNEEAKKLVNSYDKKVNKPQFEYKIDFSNRLYRFKKRGYLENFNIHVVNYENALEQLKTAS